jgi:uncharacterized protein with PIN domain
VKTNKAMRNAPPPFPRVGTRCPSCSDMLLAPAASEYVNEREVRHFWSCESCGHELETSVRFQAPRYEEVTAAMC